jgi:hypothetical protein
VFPAPLESRFQPIDIEIDIDDDVRDCTGQRAGVRKGKERMKDKPFTFQKGTEERKVVFRSCDEQDPSAAICHERFLLYREERVGFHLGGGGEG